MVTRIDYRAGFLGTSKSFRRLASLQNANFDLFENVCVQFGILIERLKKAISSGDIQVDEKIGNVLNRFEVIDIPEADFNDCYDVRNNDDARHCLFLNAVMAMEEFAILFNREDLVIKRVSASRTPFRLARISRWEFYALGWADLLELVAVGFRDDQSVRPERFVDTDDSMFAFGPEAGGGEDAGQEASQGAGQKRERETEKGKRSVSGEDGETEAWDNPEYVLISELWSDRSEFKRFSDVTKYLKKLPDLPAPLGIRNLRKGQRRKVHEADWHQHFRKKDKAQSELLDSEALQEEIADIESRKIAEREAKKNHRK